MATQLAPVHPSALSKRRRLKICDLKKGAQPGDQVANDRGQLFLITAVTESTFTVGEVVGNVGVQIDDEDLSATSVWSSQKVQERIGSPVDFVKIFESELDSSE